MIWVVQNWQAVLSVAVIAFALIEGSKRAR
jgi:hypothetical protein